jgi:hypothetical protein
MGDAVCYTLLAADDGADAPSLQDLKTQLEKGDDEMRVAAMKRVGRGSASAVAAPFPRRARARGR